MLADDNALRAILLDGGVPIARPADTVRVHVNMATVSVAFADELAARHAARGIAYIAAPVLADRMWRRRASSTSSLLPTQRSTAVQRCWMLWQDLAVR